MLRRILSGMAALTGPGLNSQASSNRYDSRDGLRLYARDDKLLVRMKLLYNTTKDECTDCSPLPQKSPPVLDGWPSQVESSNLDIATAPDTPASIQIEKALPS